MMVGESLLAAIADPGDRFAPMVLAHEVAHLWFGCLVEGRWWDDLWLAEALATYLSYGAVPGQWAEFGMREKAAAYQADLLPGAEPVAAPVASAAAALTRSPAITYSKGASVIRQLGALIGETALDAGLHDYLVTFGGGATTLTDLVGCWAAASGRDLSGWAERWLRAAGADTLTAELTLAADGTVGSLAVLQDPPGRVHHVAVGLYDQAGGGLRRRGAVRAELAGARTELPGLGGTRAPDAVLVNDGDLTFARARFDARSFRVLTACALEVSDPLTEAVAWNAAWDMLASAELPAGEFTGLVGRRIGRPQPPPGLARLLERAVAAADGYAAPEHRAGLREKLAAAALAAAAQAARQRGPVAGSGRAAGGPAAADGGAPGLAEPGRARALALAAGFAASAQSPEQLGVLRSWLAGAAGPAAAGAALKLELRAQLLATLAARGLAGDDELDALAAADPASGAARRATCAALRPDRAAKEAAWAAALTQAPTLALAHAGGFWAAGQEELLAPYRERYFAEALPALRDRDPRTAGRLARLLYPAVLPDAETIAATDAALAGDLGAAVRPVLAEQRAITQQRRAARALSRARPPA
jgi:aminopeptidase N